MESESIRVCDRQGCENPVKGKANARFCSPTCRRKHSRLNGDGVSDRRWVPGRWVAVRPSKPRGRKIRAWESVSPVVAFLAVYDGHRRPQGLA